MADDRYCRVICARVMMMTSAANRSNIQLHASPAPSLQTGKRQEMKKKKKRKTKTPTGDEVDGWSTCAWELPSKLFRNECKRKRTRWLFGISKFTSRDRIELFIFDASKSNVCNGTS